MSFDIGELAGSVLEAGAQAIATKEVLDHQEKAYGRISDERIRLMNEAVNHFLTAVKIQMGQKVGGVDHKDRFFEAFGSKPKHAAYEEVDTAALGKETAEDSLRAVPAGQRYVQASNRIMEQESLIRAIILDGRYLCVEEVTSCTIAQMLNGELPIGDVLEIIKDGAERAAMQGRIGNTHALTARDLGISRLRMKTAGMKYHFDHLQSLNANVHRVGDRVSISEFLQTPAQRLGFALAQAQLIQQSLQNKYNLDAAGDPTAMGKLQAKMQEAIMMLGTEAQRGNMINQFVPNYAALLAPAIQNATQALTKPMSGDFKTSEATVPAVTGTSQVNRTSSAKEQIPSY